MRLHPVDVDRGRRGDALIDEEIFAAPDAGIVIDLRRQQAGHGAEALTAMEGLWGRCPARLLASERSGVRGPRPASCASRRR